MKGYHTYIFAAIIAVYGVVQVAPEPSDVNGWLNLAMAAGIAVLRTFTTSPPGQGH